MHTRPTRNGNSALEHFERSNVIEIHNEIMFNFYPGLPHIIQTEEPKKECSRSEATSAHVLLLRLTLQTVNQKKTVEMNIIMLFQADAASL